jgi:hypothetical protein
MMTADDIFDQTKDAYLCLIHPVRQNNVYRREIASVIVISPSVSDELVADLIVGISWRERLLGLCLAMTKRPSVFIDPMLSSLKDVRGISIVPTCAALAVMASHGLFQMASSFADMFDRSAFDGEVGWACDKAMQYAGLLKGIVTSEKGPNYGQSFANQTEVYEWIIGGQHPPAN